MAILKHIANKSGNYNKTVEYLIFQHNEFTQKPIKDESGNMLLREEFYLDGINCEPSTFSLECEQVNKKFCKNSSEREIKSHHYIISFDPKDVTESGLIGERAQKLGLEFARKYFAGHQTLVCTHTDGHNESGNIHVHIILNSVRKLDIAPADFTERPCDSRAGFKHHLTDKLLQHMQQTLMDICEREHLHQVDLLFPAADKITEREYWKVKRENDKLAITDTRGSENADSTDRNGSRFQTQKQFLRNAIAEVSSYAVSPEEFGADLQKYYGITFKISRGRYSYLHPERSKYITGRNLGDSYTEQYLIPLFEGNNAIGRTRRNMIPASDMSVKERKRADLAVPSVNSPEYDPSFDYTSNPVAALHFHTKLRLVVDLQNCAKAQLSRAYARKVKLSNLQQMAQTICYVQEHGINTQTELNELNRAQEQLLQKTAKSDPSYSQLRHNVKELNIVCTNVKIILQAEQQHKHRKSIEKKQSID